jgi:hypothetical protein
MIKSALAGPKVSGHSGHKPTVTAGFTLQPV